MRVVRHDIHVPAGERVALHHITDLHVGAPDFAEAALRERLSLVAEDPFALVTLGGDHGDLIRHNDRRYSPTELHPRYRQATDIRLATLEHLQELLDPIRDRIIAVADGNHERKMDEFFGGHFTCELACNLGVESKVVDYRGFVSLNIYPRESRPKGMAQLIDIQHGWQAGRTRGAVANQAEKDMGATEANIVLRGHSHRPQHETYMTLGVNIRRDKVVTRPRTFINGGSWRTGFRGNLPPIDRNKLSEAERSMWHETKGFRIEDVGGPVLLLQPVYGQTGWNGGPGQVAFVDHTVVAGRVDKQSLGL